MFGMLGILSACGGEYDVRLSIEPAELRTGARLAEVAVVSDCALQSSVGPIRGAPILSFDLDAQPPSIGSIDEGTHGLFARLVSAECEVIAAGCLPIEVEGGGEGTFEVVLREASGPACGRGESCDLGRCAPSANDAGADVRDAQVLSDVAPSDSDTGCADCESTDCENATCVEGVCAREPVPDGSGCGSGQCHGGECCTGCWDGSACLVGDVASACGGEGAECATCECPLNTCDAGACAPQAPFRSVSFSLRSGCYVLASGVAYCAGHNDDGQLGIGTRGERVLTASRVVDISDWLLVSAGFSHSCGIREGNELYCWGSRTNGQTGLGVASPVQVLRPQRVDPANTYDWVETKYNQSFTIARRTTGEWVAFGSNPDNRLNILGGGDPIVVPTQVHRPNIPDWSDLRLGGTHMCGLTAGRQLYCWGSSGEGQLGVVPGGVLEMDLASDELWDEVRTGTNFTCVRRTGEPIHCMGDNGSFRLGRPTVPPSFTLRETDELGFEPSMWLAGTTTQCAFGAEGNASCWGRNDFGEVGFGDTRDLLSSIVPAPHLMGTATSLYLGTRVGYFYREGNYVWGENDLAFDPRGGGRLGFGTLENILEPTLLCIDEE